MDSEKYIAYVRTWTVSRLKKSMAHPAAVYVALCKEYGIDKGCDHEFRTTDFKNPNTVCTCGNMKIHAEDCLAKPHLNVYVLDEYDSPLSIPSLFLEPVAFDEEALEIFHMEFDPKDNSNEAKAAQSSIELLPKNGRAETIVADNSGIETAGIIESPTESVENNVSLLKDAAEILGDAFIKPVADNTSQQENEDVERKYSFLLILRNGRIIIKSANEAQSEKFIFYSKERQCVYADSYFPVGEMQFFQKGPEYAAMVAEGDPEHLKIFIEQILVLAMGLISYGIKENIPRVSDD